MAKITRSEAKKLAIKIGVDFKKDFFENSRSAIEQLPQIAKLTGYKKSATASGSTARMFFYHLQKIK